MASRQKVTSTPEENHIWQWLLKNRPNKKGHLYFQGERTRSEVSPYELSFADKNFVFLIEVHEDEEKPSDFTVTFWTVAYVGDPHGKSGNYYYHSYAGSIGGDTRNLQEIHRKGGLQIDTFYNDD